MIYVDDYKLSGPKENLAEGWKLLRAGIKTDDPASLGRYLGCMHRIHKLPDRTVIEYDMESFLQQCLERYEKACSVAVVYKPAPTPFLDDKVFTEDQLVGKGVLATSACAILMKILYCARLARFDLLRGVCALASFVSRWTEACDMKLYRLMCYIRQSLKYRLICYVGNQIADISLQLFADADHAGDKETAKSTSGMLLALRGSHTFFPLTAQSKKQTAVSHSTPEAELVSADAALRLAGLPASILWDKVFNRTVQLTLEEDNQTAIRTMQVGYSPTMR